MILKLFDIFLGNWPIVWARSFNGGNKDLMIQEWSKRLGEFTAEVIFKAADEAANHLATPPAASVFRGMCARIKALQRQAMTAPVRETDTRDAAARKTDELCGLLKQLYFPDKGFHSCALDIAKISESYKISARQHVKTEEEVVALAINSVERELKEKEKSCNN